MTRRTLFIAIVFFCLAVTGHAQQLPLLLKDINPDPAPFGSYNMDPAGYVQMDGVTYYVAYTANLGRQLWRTDGTVAGTRVITNNSELSWRIFGRDYEIPASIVPMAGNLYFFTAKTEPGGLNRFYLVRSDTAGNTLTLGKSNTANSAALTDLMLTTSNPTFGDAARRKMVAFGNALYFAFADDTHGIELWKSDGTAAGTGMLKDLNGTLSSSSPANFTVVGNTLYFTAEDANRTLALWKTDGTAAGTVKVKDAVATTGYVRQFVSVNNKLYFIGLNADTGELTLWESDGTNAGTTRVDGNTSGSLYSAFLAKLGNSIVYKVGGSLMQYAPGSRTTLNTAVIPINAGGRANQWTEVNGVLYFAGLSNRGNSLWKTDGTAAGTVSVMDGITTFNYLNAGGILYFDGQEDPPTGASAGIELWKSNGTAAGTVRLSDFNANPLAWSGNGIFDLSADYPMVYQNGKVLLTAINDVVTSTVPNSLVASSDGTPAGTSLMKLSAFENYGSFPATRFVWNNRMYFAAYEPATGYELWTTDGTPAGTSMLRDLNPGSRSSYVQAFTPYKGLLYFLASDSTGGQWRHALWRTDGTDAGSIKVKDFLGRGYNDVCKMEVSDTTLVLIAGGSFYKSDGSPAGTEPIFMLYPGAGQESIAMNFVILDNNTAIVAAANSVNPSGTYAQELWNLNLAQKTSTRYSTGYLVYNEMVRFNGAVYLTKANAGGNFVLWKTDGTTAGTSIVDLTSGPRYLSVLNNGTDLYYLGTDASFSTSVAMRLHAGAGGPVTIGEWYDNKLFNHQYDDIYSFYYFQGPQNVNPVFTSYYHHYNPFFTQAKPGGPVYMPGGDAATGIELYSTDGTPNSATLVRDIGPGLGSGSPRYITPFATKDGDTMMVFVANDGKNGAEIWYSDGSSGGTRNYAQSLPGSNSLDPRYLTLLNGKLIFWGNSHAYGTEPYVYEFQQILKAGGTISKAPALGLYPNPADQQLTVRAERGARIEVYNMTGVKVLETSAAAAATTLETGKLVPGIYNVRVTTGTSQQTGRFVKL